MPRRVAWSPGYAATLASVVLVGPVGASLVGIVSAFSLRRGLAVPQRIFNGAMYTISAYAAGRVFLMLGGTVGLPDGNSFPAIIGPFAGAAVAHVIANYGLVAGILWLTSGADRA